MKKILSAAMAVCLVLQPAAGLAEPVAAESPPSVVVTQAPSGEASEEKQNETPEVKVEKTAAAPENTATEAPTKAPVTEAPKTEAPVTEAPKTDAPATEAPKADEQTNAPGTDAPTTGNPTDAPTDAPATGNPTDAPTDASTTGNPTDAPADVPTTGNPTDAPTDAPTTGNPTDAPTDAPTTGNPTDAPTDAPTTDNPTDAPTDAPTMGTPTDAPTDAPTTGNPTDAPTDAPTTGNPTDAPTDVPTDEPIIPPELTVIPMDGELPQDVQAWTAIGEKRICGKLEDVLACAGENAEIYLCVPDILMLEKAELKRLSTFKYLPDKTIFKDGEYRVVISEESPEVAEAPVELDPEEWADFEETETADLYVWVEEVPPEITPDPSQPPVESASLTVEAENYTGGQWQSAPVSFHLSGIPEGKQWSYAAVIYDERIMVMSGDTYNCEAEGVYAIRFVMLDEIGDIVDASEQYTLWLDYTQPDVSVTMDMEKDYTMYIDASDSMSGLKALSLDGGATWIELNGESDDHYTVSGKMTLAAGMVQVSDNAGNIWISPEKYKLEKIPKFYYGGGGGGGGGSSASAKQHASGKSSDGSEVEYNALVLTLPEEPMTELTIDGQTLALTLELTNAEGFEVPEDYQPQFTASLTAWTQPVLEVEGDELPTAVDQKMDTLVLKAEPETDLGDRFEYRWKFNGEVYRLLANSGINYLALQIGDDMAVFPTEGFVGGTKYTELKMLGVSTRKFDYTVAMTFNLDPDHIPMLSENDFSGSCDLAVMVEVENMQYVLSAQQKGEMYYYNVYLGPENMTEIPYGTYGGAESTDQINGNGGI